MRCNLVFGIYYSPKFLFTKFEKSHSVNTFYAKKFRHSSNIYRKCQYSQWTRFNSNLYKNLKKKIRRHLRQFAILWKFQANLNDIRKKFEYLDRIRNSGRIFSCKYHSLKLYVIAQSILLYYSININLYLDCFGLFSE